MPVRFAIIGSCVWLLMDTTAIFEADRRRFATSLALFAGWRKTAAFENAAVPRPVTAMTSWPEALVVMATFAPGWVSTWMVFVTNAMVAFVASAATRPGMPLVERLVRLAPLPVKLLAV